MAKLRSALLTGPKTIEELMDLGISRATTYRDLGVLSKSGEVVQQPIVEEGSVRFTYILTSATPPADDERVLVAMKGVKSENPKVKQHRVSRPY